MRSTLHIAAQSKNIPMLLFLLECFEYAFANEQEKLNYLNMIDRWGYTCLDIVYDIGFTEGIEKLESLHAKRNKSDMINSNLTVKQDHTTDSSFIFSNLKNISPKESVIHGVDQNQSIDKTFKILYAIYKDDLGTLITYRIKGYDLYASDYDGRNGLHIAACENRVEIFKYLINHIPSKNRIEKLNQKDRFGYTP